MSNLDLRTLVESSLDAFNRGDWTAWKALHAPNAVSEQVPTGSVFTGHDEIIASMTAWKAAFPDLTGSITQLLVSGDKVVLELEWTGTHSGRLLTPSGIIEPTARVATTPAIMISTVENGLITNTRQYYDLLTLLRQIDAAPGVQKREAGA